MIKDENRRKQCTAYTQYAEVNQVLKMLISGIHTTFNDAFLGFYLYGSLIWGDFDITTSDIIHFVW